MSANFHRDVTFGRDLYGEPVASVPFSADELRALADGLGSHDGGFVELNAIADELEKR